MKGRLQKIIWIAQPTDDLIDQWEALAEAVRRAGAEIRPLGLDTYPRSTEAEFLIKLQADLNSAHLFVQLLGQIAGRRPTDSAMSFTALQSSAASIISSQKQCAFLQWRNRDINLDQVTDKDHRRILTGAIACGFEEFRQHVLAALHSLNKPSSTKHADTHKDEALTICISAHKVDNYLALQVRDILVELGVDALTSQNEPAPNQSLTEFNLQLDEIITYCAGMIIVYGQAPTAWVQAQYMRARKALARRERVLWLALLDGPPIEKPDAGLRARNLMRIDCRNGLFHHQINPFVDMIRGKNRA